MNCPTSVRSQSPDWRYTHTKNSTLSPTSISDTSTFRSSTDIKTLAPSLPPLAHLDIANTRRDIQENSSNDTQHMPPAAYIAPSLNSPMSGYPGPPPPYSSCVNTSNTGAAAATTTVATEGQPDSNSQQQQQLSSIGERRASHDETDDRRTRPAMIQTLPSIHEALGKDPASFYQESIPYSTSIPPRPPSLSTVSPTTPVHHSHSNSFSSQIPNQYKPQISASSNTPKRPVLDTFRAIAATHEAHRYGLEPRSADGAHVSPHTIGRQQQPQSHPSTPVFLKPMGSQQHFPPPPPPPPASQTNSNAYPPAYSYPPPSSYPNQVSPADSWRGEEFTRTGYRRNEDTRHAPPKPKLPDGRSSPGPYTHGESVKRHLETFDLGLGLNELAEASSRTQDFARKYVDKAHNMHRSGIDTALPSLAECDDMLHLHRTALNSLERIREIVLTQEHALAEQRSREEASKVARQSLYQDPNNSYIKDEGTGGFAGADSKKRRGRHAPPGRCHSCARQETPEWRRGPDGARTLCNACGLHYAKLTRKIGNKGSTLPTSNLRPKDNTDPAP